MTWLRKLNAYNRGLMSAEAEGGSGGGDDAGSIMFPGDAAGGADTQPGGEGNDTQAGGAGEWKEYESDPAKTDEENAAAKAEHDKAKPAECRNHRPSPPPGARRAPVRRGRAVPQPVCGALRPLQDLPGERRR